MWGHSLLFAPCGAPVGRRQHCRAQLQLRSTQPPQIRRAHLFWDLDNISARDAEHALVVGHRLRKTVQRLTGLHRDAVALTAFCNERTVGGLIQRSSSDESWQAVLEMLQAEVEVAGLERDAADKLMRRRMVGFAKQHGPSAAIICVSNDQGFAPALERCSKAGAFTVAVGAYIRSAGMQWGAPPSQLPVPAAANAIVAFHPGLKKIHSNAELKLVASWQQRLGAEMRPGSRKSFKGVCVTRWLNSDRPLPQQPQPQDAAAAAAAAQQQQAGQQPS